MKVTALVPSKLNSQRLPTKNIRTLGGRPLVNYVLEVLNESVLIDDTYLYASDDTVCQWVDPHVDYKYLQRDPLLDSHSTSMLDVIEAFLRDVETEIVVQAHITCPFMKPETVDTCVQRVLDGRNSAFTAQALQTFAWYGNKPLNYSLDRQIPRTQDLEPVVIEAGLFVFTREMFEQKRRRIGDNPAIEIVDGVEGMDIDTAEDLNLAEHLLQIDRVPGLRIEDSRVTRRLAVSG